MKDFIIPKVTVAGVAIIGARIVGENAVQVASEARKKAPYQNPYMGNENMVSQKDKPIGFSVMGTPVYADVTFDSVHYTDEQGNEQLTPRLSFYAILVDVNFPRNIVKTEIQGRPGTIKEYIGEGDAQITFRGIITGPNGHYPIDEVRSLKNLIKAPVPIPVICAYLNNLDIDSIVFEDRTLGQEEGGYSYQVFSLNAISDTPQELQIT
jgi:hypothetical protein